ncbi:hypothetical protein NIES4071_90150 [Calothrix sp. NIES-4071]|nr:hypothetical protein NIES4071_90150 [Calothrix sp. NIES-4071]BAZ63282.1 hypothetical protein NIES4105_90080 [Calothrix sp. NIES-4105]
MVNLNFKSRLRSLIIKLSSFSRRLVLVSLLTNVSIFCYPPSSLAQPTSKPVEIDLFVQGLSVRNPKSFLEQGLKAGTETNITLKNQPEGKINIKSVKQIPITISVPQPDGSVKELPDPKQNFRMDILITLTGQANIQDKGLYLGKSRLKIGTPAEIEGFNYLTRATVIDVRS